MKKLLIPAVVLTVAALVLIGAGSRSEEKAPGNIVDIAVEDELVILGIFHAAQDERLF